MRKGHFIIGLFIITILIPLIYAGGVAVEIAPHTKSIDLNHGQSETIPFTITSDQDWCSLNCNWKLYDESNDKTLISGVEKVIAKKPFYKSLTLTAPTKKEAKQESGVINYNFIVDCVEISDGGWFCSEYDWDKKTATITLNYDLTPEEKIKRDSIIQKMSVIKSDLEIIEKKHEDLNAKINDQPKNLLLDDISIRLSDYYSDYIGIKLDYDKINDYQLELDYDKAMNNLNILNEQLLLSTNSNYVNLNNNLENRIKKHNEVIEKFNTLSIKIKDLGIISSSTDKEEFNYLENNFDSLKDSFELGNFNDYDILISKIDSISIEADNLEIKLLSDFKEVIKKGQKLIIKESVKTSKFTGKVIQETLNYDVSGLTNICNNLNDISKEITIENNEKNKLYNNEVNKIKTYNNNIKNINQKINNINELSKEISILVNKRGIKGIDYNKCKDHLSKVKSDLDEGDNSNINIEVCESLKKELEADDRNTNVGFFLMIKLFFKKIFGINYVNFEKLDQVSIKNIPPKPVISVITDETRTYLSESCDIEFKEISNIEKIESKDYDIEFESEVGDIKEGENICCVFGNCEPCCEGNECYEDENSYPIILLHGHAFWASDSPEYSLDAFNEIHNKLNEDGFRNGGMQLPNLPKSNYKGGEWGKVKVPMALKTTYYYNIFSKDGVYLRQPSKYESIDEYSKRLSDVVEIIKYRTGRKKVNIVAHSMGGLVARNYIKNHNGGSSVNKLIMVATPNHGVYGKVAQNCDSVLILKTGAEKECKEMKADSDFLNKLNPGDETPGDVKYYTIAGTGCSLGMELEADGIVRVKSVELNGAKNVKVNGKCEGSYNRAFHSNLLDPNKYPKTYEYIKQFLKE